MTQQSTMKIAIVGAGLSGATLAYQLSAYGFTNITVFEQRGHVAGNAHTERDPETGIMLHKYGPHIFHTDRADVWRFVQMFGTFEPYIQRTKGLYNHKVYSLPINLHTINQFFGKTLSPSEAHDFIGAQGPRDPGDVRNFEDVGIKLLGRELYCAFIEGYTKKQWGRHPSSLPASILKRLPMRFDYNDNAFFHRFQGIPTNGYTELVRNMLDKSNVTVHLGKKLNRAEAVAFDHVFYSGPIDEWFDYKFGRLAYRTLDFEVIRSDLDDFQGCSVLNNLDLNTPWTRSTEHKHFTPWEEHRGSVVYREYPREAGPGDTPYYPIRLADEQKMLHEYQTWALGEARITFIGRLGTYQYLDMDATIAQAVEVAKDFRKRFINDI